MKLKLHEDLQALAELIGELGFSWSTAQAAVGAIVKVKVGDNQVTVARYRERLLTNDRIPGIPVTSIGEGFLRYEVNI